MVSADELARKIRKCEEEIKKTGDYERKRSLYDKLERELRGYGLSSDLKIRVDILRYRIRGH